MRFKVALMTFVTLGALVSVSTEGHAAEKKKKKKKEKAEKVEKTEETDSDDKSSSSSSRTFGLGVVVAGPTGLTAEYIYAKNRDVALDVGWGDDYLHLNLDHHWNRIDLIKADGIPINIYYGIGARVISYQGRDDREQEVGVRVPVGVQHIFREVPIQIFFELAPAINIVPRTDFIIDIALGARYFF